MASSRNISSCLALFSFFVILACTSDASGYSIYTKGFEWNPAKFDVVCEGRAIDPHQLLKRVTSKMLDYLDEQGLLEGNDDLDFSYPNYIGFKQYRGNTFVRYDFENPLETAPSYIGGGVVVTLEPCSETFLFAGSLMH